MVAGIAVHDVEGVHLVEVVLGGIGRVHAAHARVEAATQNGCEAGLFKLVAIGPLPAVLEVCHVFGLIVGRVEIVDTALEAGIHDGEVLVGQGQVDDQLWLVPFEQGHKLRHLVGVDLVGGDVAHTQAALDGGCHLVAFLLVARGNHNLVEHIGILGALEGAHGAHATATNDKYFVHVLYCCVKLFFS